MSILKTWAPYFQSSVRAAGRDDQMAGKVVQLPPTGNHRLRAEVHDNKTYLVTIDDQGHAQCTCTLFITGAYCRHIWAAMLDVHISGLSDTGQGSAIANITPVPPKAQKKSSRSPSKQKKPAWMGKISLLSLAPGEPSQSNLSSLLSHQEVCYIINAERSTQRGGVVIEFWQRHPTQNGWSKMKPLKIDVAMIDSLNDPIDREIAAAMLGARPLHHEDMQVIHEPDRSHDIYRLRAGAQRNPLKRIIETGRSFVDDGQGTTTPLQWDNAGPWILWLVADQSAPGLNVDLQLRRGDQHMPLGRPTLVLGGPGGVVIYDGQCAPFDDNGATRWVSHFRDDLDQADQRAMIDVPTQDIERFLARLYLLPGLPQIELPAGIGRDERGVQPEPHMALEGQDMGPDIPVSATARHQLVGRLWFDYEGHRVNPGQEGRFVSSQERQQGKKANVQPAVIRRDLHFEKEAMASLAHLGFRANPSSGEQTVLLAARHMPEAVRQLTEAGWHISTQQGLVRRPPPTQISIKTGIDWFEVHGSIQFDTDTGKQTVTLPQILAAATAGKQMIKLRDGSQGLLPTEWIGRQGMLSAMAQVSGDHLRFNTSQLAMLDALLQEQELIRVDHPFEQARQRLRKFEQIKALHETDTFNGKLRPYQREGLGWLEFLRWLGTGGILADDMGLGKTVQVLAMLESRYIHSDKNASDDPARHPTLIIVPRSIVFNWIDEAERFTPQLKMQAYTGAERQELLTAFGEQHVIITSYGLLRRDIAQLREHEFDYIVLDEAQAIKNPNSQSAKAARLLRARHRLALTGTPVENHLGDLWSIFEFLNTGMLGTPGRFGNLIKGAVSDQQNKDCATQAARALRPFILRRTKQQVLTELPKKTEQTIVCEMEPPQRKIYDQLLQHYRSTLLTKINTHTLGGSAIMVLEALLRLRQAACHPALIDPKQDNIPSAKLETLAEKLAELIDEGHKVLVFSQFTSFLSLVRKRLEQEGIEYEYLDGKTRNRKEVVHRFQTDPTCPLFLISLKAGGLGLNLTAADYVFILDPWWNPAVEQQAIDRAHRIGQTRPVFAYRLICQNSIEQRIIELQEKKKTLADAIIGSQGSLLKNLTREELQKLLA